MLSRVLISGFVNSVLISTFLHHVFDKIDKIPARLDEISRNETHPDATLEADEIILKYGYPLETHYVITQDGYNLTLFRIPHGLNNTNATKGPVYLQHGFANSGRDWLLNPLPNMLPFLLADEGFDVFIANSRETNYSSQNQNRIDSKDVRYWNFSFHEMGLYDISAVIDYILNTTGWRQLIYICHSMGCAMFFVLMSIVPEYNSKIKGTFALAPASFMGSTASPIRLLTPLVKNKDYLYFLYSLYGQGQVLESSTILTVAREFAPSYCTGIVARTICSNVLFFFYGYDHHQLTGPAISNYVSHAPSNASVRTLTHFLQLMDNPGKFQPYDWGPLGNIVTYNSTSPPSYDLSKVTVPMYIYYGEGDALTSPSDMLRLNASLPPGTVKQLKSIEFPTWNHVDFLIGKDVYTLVYNNVISLMNNITSCLLN